MKKSLTGFTLILIMFFNLVYIYDLGNSITNPPNNVSINNLRGNEFQESDSALQSGNPFTSSKIADIPVGWNFQNVINLNPSTPSVDYNVKVILNPSNFDYTRALSDGADIRFTDLADNPLSYWIETWNHGGESIIWVKIPTAGTDSFYMNYGNPSAISESDGDATFLFFDDFSGTIIDPAKWTIETDLYSTLTVSDGIVSLKTDTPVHNAPHVHLGFNDFYVLHGQTFGQKQPNGVTTYAPWGTNIFFTKNKTYSAYERSENAFASEKWFTSDIRWVSDSLAQFNNGSYLITQTNSSTIPTTPLQVRLWSIQMYGGPGTWFGESIQSINSWGPGHSIRSRSWHDVIGPPELRCDWIFVRNCADQEPAATVVNHDLTITSPENENYPGPSKGHYPASFSFENDPSFPMNEEDVNPNLDIIGNPPVGWDAYYSAYYSYVRVIDEFLDHKKVAQFRGDSRASSAGLGIDLPSATSGTVEFWFCKESDDVTDGADGTYFTLSDVGGSIGFTIEDGDLLHGNYPGTELTTNVFPKNTWVHIRIDFDIALGWQIQLNNNTWFGLGYTLPFTGTPSVISRFDVRSLDQSPPPSLVQLDQELYLDSLGYSWDNSYHIGGNLEEGLLVDFDNPKKSVTTWDGYYPATMGFDEQLIDSMPINWFFHTKGGSNPDDSLITSSIIDSVTDQDNNNHTKVLSLSDQSGGGIGTLMGYLDRNISSGTVEVWTLHNIASTSYGNSFGMATGTFNPLWTVQIVDAYGTLRYLNGNTTVDTGVPLTENKWYRYSIDFSADGSYAGLNTYEYRFRLYDSDGSTLLYTSPDVTFRYQGDANGFRIASGESITCDLYYDAFGYSWDPSYSVGDNRYPAVYEGPELTDISWMGYSLDGQAIVTISGTTTMVMPLAGEHTIQLFMNDSYGNWYSSTKSFLTEQISLVTPEEKNYLEPMYGLYPGTYGFEDQPHGTFGTDIDFIDEYWESVPGSSDFVDVVLWGVEVVNHSNFIMIRDAQGGRWNWAVHQFDKPPVSGVIEFYLLVYASAGTQYFQLRATDDTPAIEMRVTFSASLILQQYYDGSSWQDIASFIQGSWLHNSISFDCEAGVNGQFNWSISHENSTEVGRVENIEFRNDLNTLDEIYFASTLADHQISTRYDAFGFSWDSNYNVGDNRHEGLLISYDKPTQFDWTGYSLDAGSNVTIQGNTTILLPPTGTHTIQLFGNDSLGKYYKSVQKEFQVRAIDIDVPKDMTYNTPFEGYYPGTYGFDNELPGTRELDIAFVDMYDTSDVTDIVILEELDGHNKVLKVQELAGWEFVYNNFSDRFSGTVEFWAMVEDSSQEQNFNINEEGSGLIQIRVQGGQFTWRDRNTVYHSLVPCQSSTWYHCRIEWRIDNTFDFYVDRVKLVDNELIMGDMTTGMDQFSIKEYDGNAGIYLDAVGYSWDPGYTIGDNLNEGLPLTFTYDALKEGHYPGTYSFETYLNGPVPSEWDPLIIDPAVQEVTIEESYKGHDKVLRVYDNTAAMETDVSNHFEPQSYGTVEYWWLADDITGKVFSFLLKNQTGPWGLLVGIRNDVIYYYDGSDHTIASASGDEWYHIRVDFRCAGAPEYHTLGENQFYVHVNGVRYGEFPFTNSYTYMDSTFFGVGTVSTMTAYVDAVGYSWDPDYNIGDSFYEGAINSYNTTTPLEWIGYSLDGQANATIHGNHTIAMPSHGSHTIQVVGFDYSGNFYQSDVISFEIAPFNLPSISESNDFSFDYGEVGYSILWSVSDPNPYNYTVYRNSSVYQEGTWTTTITCSLDGLEEGLHIFTCLIENMRGFQASDEVWVTILPDTTPPMISSPDDISFEEGSIGYSLTWSGSDQNLLWATVYRNVTLIYDQAWTGNDIEISLDGLVGGAKYFYNCTLLDVAGNSVFDLVFVSVLKHVSDTTTPPTSTVTTTSTTTTQSSITPSLTSISGLTTLAMLIFLPLIRLKRDSIRKKRKRE